MRHKKKILITSLTAIILILGVGYAAFSQSLGANISATTQMGAGNSAPFNVELTLAPAGTAAGGATCPAGTITSSEVTYTGISLPTPGASCTYTVTMENKGTLAAVYSTKALSVSGTSNITSEISVPAKTALAAGETTTSTIKFTYNESATTTNAAWTATGSIVWNQA